MNWCLVLTARQGTVAVVCPLHRSGRDNQYIHCCSQYISVTQNDQFFYLLFWCYNSIVSIYFKFHHSVRRCQLRHDFVSYVTQMNLSDSSWPPEAAVRRQFLSKNNSFLYRLWCTRVDFSKSSFSSQRKQSDKRAECFWIKFDNTKTDKHSKTSLERRVLPD